MRVVVTGGRDYADYEAVRRAIVESGATSVAHGGATGADTLARDIACEMDLTVVSYHADWGSHGRAAGPIRNRFMLEDFRPDLVLKFPGGKGTANCVKTAREMGIPVREVR